MNKCSVAGRRTTASTEEAAQTGQQWACIIPTRWRRTRPLCYARAAPLHCRRRRRRRTRRRTRPSERGGPSGRGGRRDGCAEARVRSCGASLWPREARPSSTCSSTSSSSDARDGPPPPPPHHHHQHQHQHGDGATARLVPHRRGGGCVFRGWLRRASCGS